jgi:hypothetical protein
MGGGNSPPSGGMMNREGRNYLPSDPVVSDKDAEEALHRLSASVDKIAKARGEMERTAHMIKHIKAVMITLEDGAVGLREAKALASNRYLKAVEAYTEAVIAFEAAKAERENDILILECWRTSSSNMRAARI